MPAPEAFAKLSPGRSDTTVAPTSRALLDGGASSGPAGAPSSPWAGARGGRGGGDVASKRSGSVMLASVFAATEPAWARSATWADSEPVATPAGRRRLIPTVPVSVSPVLGLRG
jgi:hypothetical protein